MTRPAGPADSSPWNHGYGKPEGGGCGEPYPVRRQSSYRRGGGLSGLRGRVEALDGRLYIDSPCGGPTTITAELPCA